MPILRDMLQISLSLFKFIFHWLASRSLDGYGYKFLALGVLTVFSMCARETVQVQLPYLLRLVQLAVIASSSVFLRSLQGFKKKF